MKPVPINPTLFWTCYVVGAFGPFAASFVTRQFRPLDDAAFLYSWFSWLPGACLLIWCVWSARSVLLRASEKNQRIAWLYRIVGWLALAEPVYWSGVSVRII